VRRAIEEAKIGFLMAPRYHGAFRHVMPTRVELGTRTIFNLLGPLSDPAGAKRQLLGVFAQEWVRPLAEVLGKLGSECAWVVHGEGMDELTTTGTSVVAELKDGKVTSFEVKPEDLGLPRAGRAAIAGGDPAENAARMQALLHGEKGPIRDIVLLNAGAALVVAGQTRTHREGIELAAASIDDGKAAAALAKMVAVTNEPPPLAPP
jgi:anthranilate phosphoribosyltransferase